jgi:cyanophycin synthetase
VTSVAYGWRRRPKTDVPSALPFEDSRRLTGANLFFGRTGAVLETTGLEVDDALLDGWRGRVGRAVAHLGWPRDPAAVARVHAGGASLALPAPVDQLFTASEVNEWALCAAAFERDPVGWREVEAALVIAALEQASDAADVIPPVLDEPAAFARFSRLAGRERNVALQALIDAARERGLATIADDDTVTLGSGAGGRSWPLDALPALGDVPWRDVRNVPTAVVTGSNGKTTTVRLVAACLRAAGRADGSCSTDGILVRGGLVEPGDYAGPAGTRRVLRDARVEGAVLECARGGLLRRGLAVDRADVAVVTNLSNDHFGEYGIHDLEALADVKLTVGWLVAPYGGLLVLNADDATLRNKAALLQRRFGVPPRLGWFALDDDHPLLVAHRAQRGSTCGVRAGRLRLVHDGSNAHDLGPIDSMPITVGGHATYNVANLAAAALGATSLGVPAETVRRVFAQFGRDASDNLGRLMRFDVAGATVLVDYAHNPDGLRGVLGVARSLCSHGGRLVTLLGHAGNRRDEDIAEVATVTAGFAPDLVVVKENEGHLRGRAIGEVPAILRRALQAAGIPSEAVRMCASEVEAARHALESARPGDVVVLLMHSSKARATVLSMLEAPRAG